MSKNNTINLPKGYVTVSQGNYPNTCTSATTDWIITTDSGTTSSGSYSGNYIPNTGYNTYTHVDSPNSPFTQGWFATSDTCSCCKKTKYEVWVTYKGAKLTRKLCPVCFRKAMDKLFNVKAELEEVLFGE